MASAAFKIQLQGYTPANRDATVTLINQSTGQQIERKPFLDGSLLVRGLEPGRYQIKVRHPNVILPIYDGGIALFPQPLPTFIPILVRPELFHNTPVTDIPDANLGPVQQAIETTRQQVAAIGAKAPGEVIRASDFNILAQAAVDLAAAMLELSRLVAPRGHNHPEIETRIDQVQGNLQNFADAYGKSLLELRREKEADDIHMLVENTLGVAAVDPDTLKRVRDRITRLQDLTQADTAAYTAPLSVLSEALITAVNTTAAAQPDGGEAFRNKPDIQKLLAKAETYRDSGVQHRAENEMRNYSAAKAASRISLIGRG